MEPVTLYRRLQQHLDRMPVGFPATVSGVEIRILRQLFTPGEAELALEASAIPEPAKTIHRRIKAGMTLAEVTDRLEQMAEKGLILRLQTKVGPLYGKLMFVVGFYERQLKRLTPELERDCRDYMLEAFGQAFHSKKTTQLRTVPVHKTIAIERNVATYAGLRGYVESSAGPFATMTCICRHGRELQGEKCRQTNLKENCLTLGMAASDMVRIGQARPISREEMLGLLDAADKEGLVLQPENTKNPLFVCCCCGCCCGVLTSAKRLPQPAEYFSANFQAAMDADVCDACGVCLSRCQMDALLDEDGDGRPAVDRARCIGCGLCVSTCPSGALRLVENPQQKVPPDDTRALYMQLLQERYGPWGMAKLAGRKLLGMKF
ncbi:MAG: 4Fe-4S dicluster domain-containing protein [Candidatus Solibacter sp.]|nr:4Fe-4S dicluster domain-containing protein [Candidatus Solibacter sp.]